MASRFLQVLLSATVVAFIAVGCGNRGFNPPSDEDMIHNFYAHEDAFNEITEILLNCPYGDIYPPFYPIGSATDSLCLSSLGNEKCTRLDSLLCGRLNMAILAQFLPLRNCPTPLFQASLSFTILPVGLSGRVWTSSMLTGSRRTQPMRSIGN